jgi:hypothetical protein
VLQERKQLLNWVELDLAETVNFLDMALELPSLDSCLGSRFNRMTNARFIQCKSKAVALREE